MMGARIFECTVSDYCNVADTFRSSDNVDALACINSSLDVCGAVGSWDNNICIFGKKGLILKFHLDHLIRFKHMEWVHLKCNVFKCDEKKLYLSTLYHL